MATYYTKCGHEFSKSSTARVTGYALEEDENGQVFDLRCAKCHFIVDVKEGWPDKVHKRFECRAGCCPPNHKTDYSGNANDKCTLRVRSLDHEYCEAVIAFARNHPDLSASYLGEDDEDCRRVITISCSQNKKGMAAKQELLDKFFPAQAAAPNPDVDPYDLEEEKIMSEKLTHGNCYYFLKGSCCADDNPKRVRADGEACDNFLPTHQDTYVPPAPEPPEAEQAAATEETAPVPVFAEVSVPDAEETAEMVQLPVFDYSGLNQETEDTLRMCANKIAKIKMQTVYDMGQMLKMANDALAKAGHGSFGTWCESIGFSRQSAQNYMQAYDFICQNFDRPEKALGIQPSLLFVASKPSAPPELAQAVVDGDITKHKDYIAAMDRLKETERRLGDVVFETEELKDQYDSALKQIQARSKERDFEAKKAADNMRAIVDLEQQLVQAKRNADPAKLAELGALIKEKQEQLKEKELEISELHEQLNTPVDVAVEVKEVIPEGLADAWCAGIKAAIDQIARLSPDDINRVIGMIGLDNYHVLKCDFRMNVFYAAQRLEKLNADIIAAPAPADAFAKKYAEKGDKVS